MRKNLFVVLAALSICLAACAKDQIIPFEQVPQPAKDLVAQYFDASQVSYVKLDKDLLDWEYEVRFNDGRLVEFNKAGELTKVDCKQTEVPAALVPEQVRNYVKTNFPNSFIIEWGRDDRGFKAELNNGLDLEFNRNYDFLRIDD